MSTRTEWVNGMTDQLPQGPWKGEPDKVQWVDESTGLDCLIVRAPLGALCGYVGVPPEHPWHGNGYGDCMTDCGETWCDHRPEARVRVHGGLTFSSSCRESDRGEAFGVCHVPAPGRSADVWWFGFDCSHWRDVTPGMLETFPPDPDSEYRDIGYVTEEVRALASQLAAVPT
ncbi:MAG: hypothetical protein JWM40_2949 [Frankiales bacterium]|nr:hypothetical protein [Frankiales bacterium]